MNSIIKTAILTATILVVVSMSNAQTSIYYSVDIGSDLEFSDPFQDGDEVLDPGDIYGVNIGLPQSRQLIKNDSSIFQGVDPDPSSIATKVPVQDWGGLVNPEWPDMYFDMDGEDQLTNKYIIMEGPISVVAQGGGLILNPDIILFSYEDDTKLGWWRDDVPVKIMPDHGTAQNELLKSTGWYSWLVDMPYTDETMIGLASNPVATVLDDDVDALDTETNRYWYWTSDHEAHYGTDPGDIYVTDRNVGGYTNAIDNLVLGVPDGTDIDAFEFCITDDQNILNHFVLQASGAPYLAVIFSVDEDDPDTIVNESGGLSPSSVYISLLTWSPPMLLTEKLEDIDAITLKEPPKDWGDAPTPYPTLSANSGANHTISNGYHLGTLIDKEADGQPTLMADGDDNTNLPDEDGVMFTSVMYEGQLASIVVIASGNGLLSAWIDFNHDGDWNDAGDILFTDAPIMAAANNITITIPNHSSVTPFNTFARFRFSSQSMPTPTGASIDGEVEDYRVAVYPNPDEYPEMSMDFGDAEAMYPVLLANNGARHVMATNFLGSIIDTEFDGQPSPDALEDDRINTDDEDGVALLSNVIRGSNVVIQVFATDNGFLNGWVDYNQDQDWADSGEKIINTYILSGVTNLNISVPSSAMLGETFARFRFSSISGLSYDGFAANGEVEDYKIPIMQVASTNLVVTNMVVMTNSNVEVKWNNEPNVLYALQITTNLTTNITWTTIKTVTGGMSVDSNATDDIKFYRIVAPFTP
ncbi:MAG: GEVED domain-containing protein [Kiritimatiellae bacterium]|jgi:hypothetical protein|nr:GEVED domain-containing protein [Kiritimatiellia bacterium]